MPDRLRLGVLGDVHLVGDPDTRWAWHNRYDFAGLSDRVRAAANAFGDLGVDAICLIGDLAHQGHADLGPLVDALGGGRVPIFVVDGNHDPGGRHAVLAALPKAEAATPEGRLLRGWRIAGLQITASGWFGAQCERPPAVEQWGEEPVVLLSHFPILSHALRLAERGMPYPGDLIGREPIARRLAERGAPTIVISGHLHARDSSRRSSVLQIVQAALVEPPYECTVLDLAPTEVHRRAVELTGPQAHGLLPVLADSHQRFALVDRAWQTARNHTASAPPAPRSQTSSGDAPDDPSSATARIPMKTSTAQRILTTHVGSLPRPDDLAADLTLADTGRLDEALRGALGPRVRGAVADAVAHQAQVGLDAVSDGEMSKFGYATYVKERLTGFTGPGEPIALSEFADVPGFAPRVALELDAPGCDGPISYVGHDALATDIANFHAALAGQDVTEAFMNSASPGIIRDYLADHHYGSQEAYLTALADAMKVEYDTIVAAGLLVQLDCPDLAMGRHLAVQPLSVPDFRRRLHLRVETINYALRDIPRDRVRIHLCWGNYESPHHHDIPLADILDLVLGINAGAFLFEGANPRHEHEWRVFEDVELPDDVVIVPGVIDSLTNYVEHPELVAQRIERYASIVGPERVIAGTDCGFATFANYINVHPQITWRKLQSLTDGAALASEHLAAHNAVRAQARGG